MYGEVDSSREDVRTRGLARLTRYLGPVARRQWSDPLSRGGLALLVNTGLTGVLGFGYWITAARLFPTYAVGAAGALVSLTTLFSGIGQLNLSNMLMRFLPNAGGKSRRLVLSSYSFAATTSAGLMAVSLVVIKMFYLNSRLRLDIIESTALVLAAAATAIFTIEDSVLVGLRRAVWVPVENGAFGIAKICTLFLLAPIGTAFALYSAWMIPLTLTIPVISAIMFSRFLPAASKPRRKARLRRELRSKIVRFTIGDAAGNLFTQAWTYLLPVIIAASFGASVNALFYISFLFSSTIDQVASNYASPLVVEGAHAPEEIATLIPRALRRIFAIILPAVAVLLVICPWLLRAFGEKYVSAVPLMLLLLTACLPKAISTVYYAYCRIHRSTHKSAILQAYVCVATLTATIPLGHSFGLVGVGLAIVGVQSSAGVVSWWALKRGLRRVDPHGRRPGRHRRSRGGETVSAVSIPAAVGDCMYAQHATYSDVSRAGASVRKLTPPGCLGERADSGRTDWVNMDVDRATRRRP